MVYIPVMRILIIGDTPLCNRLSTIYANHFSAGDGVQVKSKSDDIFNVLAQFRPDVVVNGIFSETDDPTSFVANSKDAALFALYARMVGAKFYHLSDSSVFNTDLPRSTDDPYPTRVYGLSRLLGERAIQRLHPKATIIRTSWLYGPEIPESPPMVAWSARNGDKKKAHVYNDVKLSPTFVGDAAAILSVNILSDHLVYHSNEGQVFHLAPHKSITWFDYLKDEFPDILPMRSRFMLGGSVVRRNVSVHPSERWVVHEGGLGRFLEDLNGNWNWLAAYG